MSDDLAFAGAARQAEMVRCKEVSPRELVDLYLERIERLDPQLNAFRVVMADRARAEAAEAERRLAHGDRAPLIGVPIAIKDGVEIEGETTPHGTDAFGDQPASADAAVVARIRAAGAVVIGKTHLPELAIHGYTESQTFGITRNPWNPERTSGGSSGGAAAAVAAGMVPIAHASDGAGSIRFPAAHCALFGLKPQRNRVTMEGESLATEGEHWFGLSVNGCVSRTVLDTALFLDAVSGGERRFRPAPPPPIRPYVEAAATPPPKLRVAVTTEHPRLLLPVALGSESVWALETMVEVLRGLGHQVEWRDPDWGNVASRVVPRYLGGIAADVDATPYRDRLEPITKGYRRLARVLGTQRAARRAVTLEERDRERIGTIFDQFDLLMTPLTAGPPFEHGRFRAGGAVRGALGESRFYPYAVVWNHTGQPAAAVPAGLTDEGLPIAVQMIAASNREETLISLAAQVESETGWPQRHPLIS